MSSFIATGCHEIVSPFMPRENIFMKMGSNPRAVVVAQLVERWHLTPEIRGLNPNIGKVLSTN